jgi:predicted transcriptional regulator
MTDNAQVKISFNEDADVMRRIDEIADREGTSRTAIIRRAIRAIIHASPVVATVTYRPHDGQTAEAPK